MSKFLELKNPLETFIPVISISNKTGENVDNLKLLLLSATPMYNDYREIIYLVNLMNRNDNRSTIQIKDVFTSDGKFIVDSDGKEIGKELLRRKIKLYLSAFSINYVKI